MNQANLEEEFLNANFLNLNNILLQLMGNFNGQPDPFHAFRMI
jgi:hypothetical protein